MLEVPYDESMTAAENACFAHLCGKLGYTPGVNAFLGVNGGLADCIVFDVGMGYTGDLNTWRSGYAHMRAQLDIYSRSRVDLQKAIMRVMRSMPIDENDVELAEGSNVVNFRLAPDSGNPGAVKTIDLQIKTDRAPIPCYTATIMFDVVFACPRN